MSRPTPRGQVEGLAGGCIGPDPGGGRGSAAMATAADSMHPTGMHSCTSCEQQDAVTRVLS